MTVSRLGARSASGSGRERSCLALWVGVLMGNRCTSRPQLEGVITEGTVGCSLELAGALATVLAWNPASPLDKEPPALEGINDGTRDTTHGQRFIIRAILRAGAESQWRPVSGAPCISPSPPTQCRPFEDKDVLLSHAKFPDRELRC